MGSNPTGATAKGLLMNYDNKAAESMMKDRAKRVTEDFENHTLTCSRCIQRAQTMAKYCDEGELLYQACKNFQAWDKM